MVMSKYITRYTCTIIGKYKTLEANMLKRTLQLLLGVVELQEKCSSLNFLGFLNVLQWACILFTIKRGKTALQHPMSANQH